MRLGVVEGNARAERFWERCAFTEVRKRHDIEMGARTNTVRVMARPLDGGTVRVELTAEMCSDGRSETAYGAKVVLRYGSRTYEGCAARF